MGTPDPPPPYTVEPAFPRLKPKFPVVLVRASGTHRLFLGELRGRISSFPDDPGCANADLAMDLTRVHPDLTALYGLAFHPQFEQNRYVYVCYVLKNDFPDGSVVARFTMTRTDPPVIDPRSEQVILRFYSGGHNAGCLDFGNDGFLYLSTGDGGAPSPPDPLNTGQDCSDLLSCILRVDVDHPEPGKSYRVPPDNPFIGMDGVRPEIWAFGFRNPWKMSFDRATGDLWLGDVGWELWEMVYRVKRGGNYGWSVMEGPQPVRVEDRRGPGPILPPLKAHPHSEAASVTGGYVYHGKRLPELAGAYLYGDYQTGTVWSLRARGDSVVEHKELARTPLHLVAFGENRDGELYLIDHDRTHQIYRLVRNPATNGGSDFPRHLSQTGLFASTREHRPAPGVIPYFVNAELWADGATAERYLAVPGEGRIRLDERGNWRFPEGSVLVRTVSVADAGHPSGKRRVETQLLHFRDDAWRPYSYVWDDAQMDAALVDAAGTVRTIAFDKPDRDGRRTWDYRVHARAECILCHNPWVERKTLVYGVQSASPLGINAPQMNRTRDDGGRAVNQLKALHELGLLSWTPEPGRSPRLVDPYDESADLGLRARSYLQTNCAHCHQFNAGGTANIALGYELPLAETRTVDVRPIQGTFQIAGARIIAPGDPSRSVLYYRVSKLGGGRMPRVGSDEVDVRAVRMLRDWIAAMPANPKDASEGHAALSADDRAALDVLRRVDQGPAEARSAAIGRLTSSARGALLLLDLLDRGPAGSDSLRREVVAMVRQSSSVEIRDLFERFIPRAERARRLGDVVDRRAILSLPGDARRGRAVFADNPSVQCKTCHRVGDVGQAVGPDLTKVGAKYDRAALLEQILEPSRTIEPPYQPYLVETRDGQVLTGLVVERTAQEVKLKDAQGKTVRIPGADVERLVPQGRSLMPELLLRDLTAQQVADLLEYLAGLR